MIDTPKIRHLAEAALERIRQAAQWYIDDVSSDGKWDAETDALNDDVKFITDALTQLDAKDARIKVLEEALRQSARFLRSIPADSVYQPDAWQFAAQNEEALKGGAT